VSILRGIDVKIVYKELCQNIYEEEGNVTARMVCAGVPGNGELYKCRGDIGGPLVIRSSGKQYGIISWGTCMPKFECPAVFANLADEGINDFVAEELKY